jgi:hypothetical protein
MRVPKSRSIAILLAALIAAAALVSLGRVSVNPTRAKPVEQSDQYFAGLQAGEAEGRRDGRALQEGAGLPKSSRRPVHDAFEAGYVAGANDAFAGYDGGWTIGVPYVITLAEATGEIVYRIKTREPMQAGVDYYLCSDGRSLCEQPHR